MTERVTSLDGVASLCRSASPRVWMRRDHLAFYVVALAGVVLLTPRFLLLGHWAFERFMLGAEVARPNLQAWPYVPSILLPLCVVALVVYSASHRIRVSALLLAALPLGWLYGYVDLRSVPAFAGFAAVVFAIARLPVSREVACALVTALSLVAVATAPRLLPGMAFSAVIAFQAALLPVLWYSMHEQVGPRGPLSVKRLVLYLLPRFFSAPVTTYPDLFTAPASERLAEIRVAGVRAIYIAILAATATAGATWVEQRYPSRTLTGLPLLLASYVGYVGAYCKIVVPFNLFIGVVRLFGIPLRNNFDYWLLAHTPNEHWKRWNLLFREWVITFVFFPIMRARRWLFAAVMASLLTSGLLHIVPVVTSSEPSGAYLFAQSMYWVVNGLAIYVVLAVPLWFPRAVARLRLQQSQAWVVVGIVLTSVFYAVLFGFRASADDWPTLVGYLTRLATVWPAEIAID